MNLFLAAIPTLDDLNKYEQIAFGLPGFLWAAIVAFIVQWGWRKVAWSKLPNDAAWLACIFAAMAINYLLSPDAPESMPARIWRVRTGLIGLGVGFLTHVLYFGILKYLGQRWPWLSTALDSDGQKQQPPDPPKQP